MKLNKEIIRREIEKHFTEKEINLLEELTNTNILNLIDYNNLNYCLLQFDLLKIQDISGLKKQESIY